MYIRRKVYSSYIDEYGEERLFSTNEVISEEAYLGQREFNSKAAKALNNKYLKRVASKTGIPVYEAKGFKTVEMDPSKWKRKARVNNEIYTTSEVMGKPQNLREEFNDVITTRPHAGSASSDFGIKKYKKGALTLEDYDHAVRPINDIKNSLKNNSRFIRR